MQCSGFIRNSEEKCSRKVKDGNNYCWQHQKMREEKENKPRSIEVKGSLKQYSKVLTHDILHQINEYTKIPDGIGPLFELTIAQKTKSVQEFFKFSSTEKICNKDVNLLYSLINHKITSTIIWHATLKGLKFMPFYTKYFNTQLLDDLAKYMIRLYEHKFFDRFDSYMDYFTNCAIAIRDDPDKILFYKDYTKDVRITINLMMFRFGFFTVRDIHHQSTKYYKNMKKYIIDKGLNNMFTFYIAFESLLVYLKTFPQELSVIQNFLNIGLYVGEYYAIFRGVKEYPDDFLTIAFNILKLAPNNNTLIAYLNLIDPTNIVVDINNSEFYNWLLQVINNISNTERRQKIYAVLYKI